MFPSQFLLPCLLAPYKDPIKCSFLASLFEKNSACFKKSLAVPSIMPNFKEIQSFLLFYFQTKQPVCPKHFLQTNKTLIMWVLTAYEFATGRHFTQMTKQDWRMFSSFFSGVDILKLQLQIYYHLNPSATFHTWDSHHDIVLSEALIKFHPTVLTNPETMYMVSWTSVSKEFNIRVEKIGYFKSEKHCKERWFNHLNPFLIKKGWSCEEDIKILEECLEQPLEWSKIARDLKNRNQHQVKNRLVCILARELNESRAFIRQLVKSHNVQTQISLVLEGLQRNILEQRENEAIKDGISLSSFMEMHEMHEDDVDKFINLEHDECPLFDFLEDIS